MKYAIRIAFECNNDAPIDAVRHYVEQILEIGSAAVGDGALEDLVTLLSGEDDVPEHIVEAVQKIEA